MFEEKIRTRSLPRSRRKAEKEGESEAERESLRLYTNKGNFISFLNTENQN